MYAKVEQLRKAEHVVSHLQGIVKDFDTCAAKLLAQVFEAQKEVALAKGEVVEARQEVTTEKDVAVTIADEAQKIGLQAGFKILCQSLL